MPSQLPKPSALRRRGRDPRRTAHIPTRKAPRVPVDSWPDHVKAWWRAVWRHPVSSEWDPIADGATARRLGDLYALLDSAPTASMHAQAARCEAALLLTPEARQRAYLVLPGDDPPEAPQSASVSAVASSTGRWNDDDPRRLLAGD